MFPNKIPRSGMGNISPNMASNPQPTNSTSSNLRESISEQSISNVPPSNNFKIIDPNSKREVAEDLLRQAIHEDTINHNLVGAYGCYEQSLELWLEILRTETDKSKAKQITELIKKYMDRAEEIKSLTTSLSIHDDQSGLCSPAEQKSIEQESKLIKPEKKSKAGGNSERKKVPDYYDYSANSAPLKAVPKKPLTPLKPKRNEKNSLPDTTKSKVNATGNSGVKTVPAKSTVSSKPSEYEEQILEEMLDASPGVQWGDIAGLTLAKQTLQEAVILPNLRPDLFTGLRSPSKGVLLFGPPGTGKTMLAKAVASESGFAFFSITASSVTSKYLGEGEKLMKALFEVARQRQPAVIFFDEIDALMSSRKESEHEASRRLKTEFMVQIDGAATNSDDRILVMGATNLPWTLDEAVLRRLAKRIYVPLPDDTARLSLLSILLKDQLCRDSTTPTPSPNFPSFPPFSPVTAFGTAMASFTSSSSSSPLSLADLPLVVRMTEGYSGSDLAALCREASMEPIREMSPEALRTVKKENIRPLQIKDFVAAVTRIRPSVSPDSLNAFVEWSSTFGTKS